MRRPGLYIIFDGPPSHESGRFVEVEDETGRSVGLSGREWIEEENGLWALGPFQLSERIHDEEGNHIG